MSEQEQVQTPTELEQFQQLLTVSGKNGKAFLCFIFEGDSKNLKAMDPIVFGNVNIAYVAQKAKLMKETALKQLEFNSIQSACKTEEEARQILSV